jgi:hypothetical protein
MKRIVVIVCFCSWLLDAIGQVDSLEKSTTRSSSGQFIVYGLRRASPLPRSLNNATNLVRLEPTFLAVSCERIKQALLRELDATSAWRGKVYLILRPVKNVDDRVEVSSSRFSDGWTYRVELPDAIEAPKLVGAVVQVLLLEMANRNASSNPTALPIWLMEGLSQELLAASELDLVLQPPQQTINNVNISQKIRSNRKSNPLAAAHERLRSRPPLTIQELSWPTDEQLSDQAGEVYRCSAQLFVHELLQLKNGRASLRTMVEQLPQNLNWQTTFLRAFRVHFTRQLDVEKWWALQLVHFTGRDLTQTWPNEASWKKLDEIVRSQVQVRISTNELPLRSEVSLQTIIREWDYLRQNRVLRDKLDQLQRLRLRMSQDLVFLVDDYRQTLETYLQKVAKAGLILNTKRQDRPDVKRFLQETLNQLDMLDAQRETLRPNKNPIAAVPTITGTSALPETR